MKNNIIIADRTLPEGSDCIVCAKDNEGTNIEILHITEGLSFHPSQETVKVLFNVLLKNYDNKPGRFRFLHKGGTKVTLNKFVFSDQLDPRTNVISHLYQERMQMEPDIENSLRFYKRINCLGVDQNYLLVSLNGPGNCFNGNSDSIPLLPEIDSLPKNPLYTSYLVPSLDSNPIEPGETSICTIKLELSKESYATLVADGSDLSVDSYKRIKRDIEGGLLHQQSGLRIEQHYNTFFKPKKTTLIPKEYDIVIFNEIGQRVEYKSGSINATPVPMKGNSLEEKVLWYYGQPDEFCLKLSYPEQVIKEYRARKCDIYSDLESGIRVPV